MTVELENLEVKKIYERDMAFQKSQKLLELCKQKTNDLSTSEEEFDKKNYHYLIQFLDEYRQMNEKLIGSREKIKSVEKREKEAITEKGID